VGHFVGIRRKCVVKW